jgi:hypothetical protein
MRDSEHNPENSLERPTCVHDFQLETVGGAYLTGAYVCRLCSHRVGMSDSEFSKRNAYPRQYQQAGDVPVESEIRNDESDSSEVSRSDSDG